MTTRAAHPAPATDQLLLLPGAEVVMVPLDLPRGVSGAAREQVAWRQLRDGLGLGPGQVEMHPYPGRGPAGDWSRALVADAAQIAEWRARAGPGAKAMLPDYLALPATAGLWVLAFSETGLRARLDLDGGFSCDPAMAGLMLRRALAQAEDSPPKAVLALEAPPPDWLADMLSARDIPLLTDPGGLAALGLAAPVALGHGELAADLRADPRAARDRLRRRLLPWRWTALAALVALAVWTADQLVEIRRLERETATLGAELETVVRTHFVATGPILDIRVQVSRALAARQAEAEAASGRMSPLLLFGQVADVLARSEARPDLVSYTAAEGLAIDLRLADFAAADRLAETLEAAGIRAELRDLRVSGEGEGVRVDLRLRPGTGERGG